MRSNRAGDTTSERHSTLRNHLSMVSSGYVSFLLSPQNTFAALSSHFAGTPFFCLEMAVRFFNAKSLNISSEFRRDFLDLRLFLLSPSSLNHSAAFESSEGCFFSFRVSLLSPKNTAQLFRILFATLTAF